MSYTNISWAEIERWERGKLLHIAYRPESGVVLLDPQSGKYIPIISGLELHPIDLFLKKKLEKARTTYDYRIAHQGATNLWDIEIHRAYKDLLSSYPSCMEDLKEEEVNLFKKSENALVEAQRKWIGFRDAERAAIYKFNLLKQGTLHLISADAAVMDLSRRRALALVSMLD